MSEPLQSDNDRILAQALAVLTKSADGGQEIKCQYCAPLISRIATLEGLLRECLPYIEYGAQRGMSLGGIYADTIMGRIQSELKQEKP